MVHVSPASTNLVVEIVNGWSSRVRSEAGDSAAPYPPLPRTETGSTIDLSNTASHELARVADRLFDVFAEQSAEAKQHALNGCISDVDPTPCVSSEGPRWRVAKEHQAVEAALLLGLVEHARNDPDFERLGTCAAERCCDVFVDVTQAETRRYCSQSCQNRTKVAQHRRRRKDGV